MLGNIFTMNLVFKFLWFQQLPYLGVFLTVDGFRGFYPKGSPLVRECNLVLETLSV